MSMEKRILIAFVLSAAIFAVWTLLFPPPKVTRPSPATVESEQTSPVEAATPSDSSTEVEAPAASATETTPVAVTASAEELFNLDNDVLAVTVTNRGAAVTKILLKGYDGDNGEPLDLVQDVSNPLRALPLQLVIGGEPDGRLYAATQDGERLVLRWADGSGNGVVKTLTLDDSGYGLEVGVELSGTMQDARLSVGTGMRNTGGKEQKNRFATWGDVTVSADGERETYKREKTKEPEELAVSRVQFVGFEDTYFLNVYRPTGVVGGVEVTPLSVPAVDEKGEPTEIPVLRADVLPEGGAFDGQLFPAPKEYDLLKREGGGLEKTLHFGIFHPIAVFFLKVLQWIHTWVGNWGWSIILLTVGLRIALFPLMHTSTVSMRRMQKIHQETMALYKEEGVNPMGGCLPLLVQMPILFALYTLFAHAIELRHEPFILWITDLSARDPLYITPVLMTASMWLQQRLAPQAGDPQQMKLMRMMPLVFGIMFLGFPSGLVLYWLTNNVVSILQQEVTLHLIGERRRPQGGGERHRGSK
jgi:YidC/Oxa1 family membrane protein insertase